ncbi:MAG: UvrD-helicase domain-containing protein, partial [Clostridia bacterium]|nr:UvrD-helicase domain-containing protein [Clostridia bacterium]
MINEFLSLRKKIIEKDFSKMNDRQKQAVFCTDGPLLILAGAGSGKTTVIVNRIYNLIKYGKAYNSDRCSFDITEFDIEN